MDNKEDKLKKKDLLWFIPLIIFLIAILIGALFLYSDIIQNKFDKFSQEFNVFIEENELNEYQIEKIEYLKGLYRNRSDNPLGAFYIESFERFIKAEDYDFWYEIKFIFEGME